MDISITGEYPCKLDSKGRIKVPADLKKNLPAGSQDRYMLTMGANPCLALYPSKVWEVVEWNLRKHNPFDPEFEGFVRQFKGGGRAVTLDTADRLLIPKNLLEYAGLQKEIMIIPVNINYEIWDADRLRQFRQEEEAKRADYRQKFQNIAWQWPGQETS